jgi:hypothetical protein
MPLNRPAIPLLLLLLPFAGAPACGGSSHRAPESRAARFVSIQVEVYQPSTNYVWENVGVRIVESSQEWSGCTCQSPHDDWYFTDSSGQVLIDETALAAAEVGFQEDAYGRAILGFHTNEDEATVTLEVDALGFTPVRVQVPLSWDRPDVFVQVPFG